MFVIWVGKEVGKEVYVDVNLQIISLPHYCPNCSLFLLILSFMNPFPLILTCLKYNRRCTATPTRSTWPKALSSRPMVASRMKSTILRPSRSFLVQPCLFDSLYICIYYSPVLSQMYFRELSLTVNRLSMLSSDLLLSLTL